MRLSVLTTASESTVKIPSFAPRALLGTVDVRASEIVELHGMERRRVGMLDAANEHAEGSGER